MRFYNYINEEFREDIKEKIEKDCQPFLKEWEKLNTNLLYIGKSDSVSGILKKQTRQNRRPLDTPWEVHNLVDNWFKKKFGVKARSNSIFTTFYFNQASDYGYPYLVFPIGKFVAISSHNVEDLFNELDNFIRDFFKIKYNNNNYYKGIKSAFSDHSDISKELKDEVIKEIIEFLEKSKYKKGLQRHRNEQMVICKEYYLVDISNENYLYNELEVL